MRLALIAVAISALGLSTAAQAAMLDVTKGSALVNVGKGFRPGTVAQNLPIGAQIMVPAGSEARVYYNDTCFVRVQPAQVHTVATKLPCNAADAAKSTATPPEPGNLSGSLSGGAPGGAGGAAGGAGGAAGGAGGAAGGAAAAGGVAGLATTEALIIGGVAVAAGVGIYRLTQASP